MCYLLTKWLRLTPKPWYYPKWCKKSDHDLSTQGLGSLLPVQWLPQMHSSPGRYVQVTSWSHLHTHKYGLLPWWLTSSWGLAESCPHLQKGLPCLTCHTPLWHEGTIWSHQNTELRCMREKFWGEGQLKPRGRREAEGRGTRTCVQRGRGMNQQAWGVRKQSKKERELWEQCGVGGWGDVK